jgi:hypothetical protein
MSALTARQKQVLGIVTANDVTTTRQVVHELYGTENGRRFQYANRYTAARRVLLNLVATGLIRPVGPNRWSPRHER